MVSCFQSQIYAFFGNKTRSKGKLLRFVKRNFVVGLVEVLLDVFVLIGDLGPDFDLFLDAEDATFGDAEGLVKVVVDGAGDADIEWAGAFLANAHGLVNAGTKPRDVIEAVVRQVLGTHDVAVIQTHGKLKSRDAGELMLKGLA